jgi:hypothetical protein
MAIVIETRRSPCATMPLVPGTVKSEGASRHSTCFESVTIARVLTEIARLLEGREMCGEWRRAPKVSLAQWALWAEFPSTVGREADGRPRGRFIHRSSRCRLQCTLASEPSWYAWMVSRPSCTAHPRSQRGRPASPRRAPGPRGSTSRHCGCDSHPARGSALAHALRSSVPYACFRDRARNRARVAAARAGRGGSALSSHDALFENGTGRSRRAGRRARVRGGGRNPRAGSWGATSGSVAKRYASGRSRLHPLRQLAVLRFQDVRVRGGRGGRGADACGRRARDRVRRLDPAGR